MTGGRRQAAEGQVAGQVAERQAVIVAGRRRTDNDSGSLRSRPKKKLISTPEKARLDTWLLKLIARFPSLIYHSSPSRVLPLEIAATAIPPSPLRDSRNSYSITRILSGPAASTLTRSLEWAREQLVKRPRPPDWEHVDFSHETWPTTDPIFTMQTALQVLGASPTMQTALHVLGASPTMQTALHVLPASPTMPGASPTMQTALHVPGASPAIQTAPLHVLGPVRR